MKKQSVQFILLVTILLLCICGYFVVHSMPKEEEEQAAESYQVTDVDTQEVKGISYLYEGEIIDLIKEEDTWVFSEDPGILLDQSKIETMLGYVCAIDTDTMILSPDSLAEYGLSNPSNTICLTLSDDSIVQLLVGDYLDITGEYYALLAGDPNVYTISSYIPSAFEKSIDDLKAND